MNSLKARLPRVEEWLNEIQPDVLCLQETKMSDATFPALTFGALGYESVHVGQGQWNGVAILSKVGIGEVVHGFVPDLALPEDEIDEYRTGILGEARIVTARCGGLLVCSVYVPNGRSLDDPHYGAKLVWLAHLRRHFERLTSPKDHVMILGDFNVAPDDRDVPDPAKLINCTHVTDKERAMLTNLEQWGMADLFRHLYPQNGLYTYWDYRAGDFHMHRGMRIDLAYGTKSVVDATRWSIVDRNARKGKLPSDHAPLIVDVEL